MWDCDGQIGRGTGFFPVPQFSPVIIPSLRLTHSAITSTM